MTLFFIFASLLVIICLSWLLYGLFQSSQSHTDQEAVNITLARERRVTLNDALNSGAIDQASYDYEREQLEYDLAADLSADTANGKTLKNGHLVAAVLVAIFIPITAGALYLHLGDPAAITRVNPIAQADSDTEAPALTELLPQLEERLAAAPDDVNGWRLLGSSYLSINEFARAQAAFEKALALDENDVATLAQLAESTAMARDGDLSGDALSYLERAIKLDPDNEQTLWLLAIAKQQIGEHEAALAGFDRLTLLSQGNPEALSAIEQMRSRSLEVLSTNEQSSAPNTAQISDNTKESTPAVNTNQTTTAEPPTDAVNAASIQVTVSLGDTAKSSTQTEQTVFIYARASEGPPMPLAASRLSVADLPATITLDDSMAMIPSMKLSNFPSVTVGARVSQSGDPVAKPGDWFAEQDNIPVNNNENITLTIDTQTP